MRVVRSPGIVLKIADYSGCRSPSRARRRARMGHPQRIVWKEAPSVIEMSGTMYAHPDVYDRLRDLPMGGSITVDLKP